MPGEKKAMPVPGELTQITITLDLPLKRAIEEEKRKLYISRSKLCANILRKHFGMPEK